MRSLVKKFAGFKKAQDGSATVEFAILFPAFILIFLIGFESGYFMVRDVLLERAVDVSVREIRVSNEGGAPDLDTFKQNVCSESLILRDCLESIQVEMRPIPVAPGGITTAAEQPLCIDKEADPNDEDANDTVYNTGSGNQLVMVRVCALARPFFPTTRLSVGLKYNGTDDYAIVATSAFVNEPQDSGSDRDDVPFPALGGGE